MKSLFLFITIIASSFCLAQDNSTIQTKVTDKLDAIKKVLTLSPDQEVKIKKALTNRYEAITTFEQLNTNNKEAIKEEKKKQKKIYKDIFEKTLTKDQRKQWDKYKEAKKKEINTDQSEE